MDTFIAGGRWIGLGRSAKSEAALLDDTGNNAHWRMAVGATEYAYPGVIPGPRGHNVTLVELYVTDHTGIELQTIHRCCREGTY